MKKTSVLRQFLCMCWSGALLLSAFSGSNDLFAQQTGIGDVSSHQGNVTFGGSGSVTDIGIQSQRAYLKWDSFNIPDNYTANFNFGPGYVANGAVLNHLPTGTATINGNLLSNGNVFLVSPGGMVVGQRGSINTQSFVGSTHNLASDQVTQFMNGNDFSLSGAGAGEIVNNGKIEMTEGSLALTGATITNNGKMSAPKGSINILSANNVNVSLASPLHPAITIGANPSLINPQITNGTNGTIEALNAELQAVGGNVMAFAINNYGTIRVNRIDTSSGRILLKASDSAVNISGTASKQAVVSADSSSADAGFVQVSAKNIKIDNAIISAIGTTPQAGSADHGISLASTGNTTISSSVLKTSDADINIRAQEALTIKTNATNPKDNLSTLINTYKNGNININAGSMTISSTNKHGFITVGAKNGKTNVNVIRDLTIEAMNGGSAQIGYLYHDADDRLTDVGISLSDNGIYFPTGDINVHAGGTIKLTSNYTSGSDNPKFIPAALIGHALLPSQTEKLYQAGKSYYVDGDINVSAGSDIAISSTGSSIARIGHYLQDAYYKETPIYDIAREVRGNITVDSGRDLLITAKSGGNAGVGHAGDFIRVSSDKEWADFTWIKTTASRHTILSSDGYRTYKDNQSQDATWHSIAQIGVNVAGYSTWLSPERVSQKSQHYEEAIMNIQTLSGANVILNGKNQSLSLIGHENNVRPDIHNSLILVGYGFNRYKDLKQDELRNNLSGPLLDAYNQLKNRFQGKEEGYLHVDSTSRIGRPVLLDFGNINDISLYNTVAIFGYRMMQDGITSAIRFDEGAVVSGASITNQGPGGYYDPYNFTYKLGSYPTENGTHTQYDPIEYYGYFFGDYMTGSLSQDVSFINPKLQRDFFKIYYPFVTKKDTPPPPREEPRYPWIPVWFDQCYCEPCCCVPCSQPCDTRTTTCCVQTTCADALPNGAADTPAEGVPTLAPPRERVEPVEKTNIPTPTLAPAVAPTMT